MKKILALVLALAMMLCMGTAFATEEDTETPAPSTAVTKEGFLTKTWVGETEHPSEALSFDVIAAKASEDAESEVTTSTISLVMAEGGDSFTLTHDQLNPGKYYFLVKEHDNGNAGVTYDTLTENEDKYVVQILAKYVVGEGNVPTDVVTYDYKVSKAVVNGDVWNGSAGDANKITAVTNQYKDGTVTVKKAVTGNLANKEDTFNVNLTFTSAKPVNMIITIADDADSDTNGKTIGVDDWSKAEGATNWTATETMTVKAADANGYTISGIPSGVQVKVEEAADALYTLVGYVVDNGTSSTTAPTVTVGNDTANTVTITNDYNTAVETGINMDSMPYIVLMGLVVLAGVALILKKRTVND